MSHQIYSLVMNWVKKHPNGQPIREPLNQRRHQRDAEVQLSIRLESLPAATVAAASLRIAPSPTIASPDFFAALPPCSGSPFFQLQRGLPIRLSAIIILLISRETTGADENAPPPAKSQDCRIGSPWPKTHTSPTCLLSL